jgi:uncharacterized protein HemY
MTSDPEKIKRLEEILADEPDDHTGFFLLGRLYSEAERHADAAAAFRRAVDLKADYSAAWRQMGDAYRKLGDPEQAAAVYRQGIAIAEANGDLQTMKEMQVFLRKVTE